MIYLKKKKKEEYWSGLLYPSPRNLPHPGIEPASPMPPATPALQADSLPSLPPGQHHTHLYSFKINLGLHPLFPRKESHCWKSREINVNYWPWASKCLSLHCCCCCSVALVWLCATPWTVAHQAPPSLGFSRQEHWSGLPCPSPMHESEKWKWSRSVMSDS